MKQAELTIVVPILGSPRPLELLLDVIGDQVRNGKTRAADGATIPFGDLDAIHFARFALLEATRPDERSLLVFATVHDGPHAQHLDDLVTLAGDGLQQVFALCDKSFEGVPRDALRRRLDQHRVRNSAFWGGHLGRSVGQIRAEFTLRREIRAMLGHASGRLFRDPFAEVLEFVKKRHDLRWALSPPDATGTRWTTKVRLAAALGLAALLLLAASPLWLPLLLWHEAFDRRHPLEESGDDFSAEREKERQRKSELREVEDLHVQNQMTTVSHVKPGFVRWLALRLALWTVDALGRVFWDGGALNGIRTIHFAGWFIVGEGPWFRRRYRLVFLSNYDRSWEHYLGEFVDQAASGLTGVWGNTEGFPDSKWLIFAGARRELKFKRWVRSQQVKTQVWYSAYPELTVRNVLNNAEIRRGLQGLRGLEERRKWLRRV